MISLFNKRWWFLLYYGAVFGVVCGIIVPVNVEADETGEVPKAYFQPALPGYTYTFPFDHGSHDTYMTEWWYFTGHLLTRNGRRFGYELTFFRRAIDDDRVRANPSPWAIRQLYFAHLAVTDEANRRFHYTEKISRAALGKAGAKVGRLQTWIDRWSVTADHSHPNQFHLHAFTNEFGIDATVVSRKPPVIHGRQGISRKGSARGQASHYYSLTRLETTGKVLVEGTKLDVQGTSWMDHEFGSMDLGKGLVGWDWLSLQLETGQELMLYGLRRKDGGFDPASSGTFVMADGSSRHLSLMDFQLKVLDHWISPASGARYPSRWLLTIASLGIRLEIVPRLHNQELRTVKSTRVTYWEGAVDVSGIADNAEVTGRGYVELTGYAKPFRPSSR